MGQIPTDDASFLSPSQLTTPLPASPLTPDSGSEFTGRCRKRRRLNPPEPSLTPIATPVKGRDRSTDNATEAVRSELCISDQQAEHIPSPSYQKPCTGADSSDWLHDVADMILEDPMDTDTLTSQFEEKKSREADHCQIDDLPITLDPRIEDRRLFGDLSVTLEATGELRLQEKRLLIGRLDRRSNDILQGLTREDAISLQLRCVVKKERSIVKRRNLVLETQSTGSLSINIYGSYSLFNHVGEYLEACDIFLQDPQNCDRNVRYRNPHRLSGDSPDAPWTIEQQVLELAVSQEASQRSTDYLAEINSKRDLPEAATPRSISSSLYRHQKQALTFMLKRERGWDLDGDDPDIWKIVRISTDLARYCNTVTGESFHEPPPLFRGGILADQMGLGKTLTLIALIAADHEAVASQPPLSDLSSSHQNPSEFSRCTLVIVPPVLLDTWETQLNTHLRPGCLRWTRHHGSQRLSSADELAQYNIVLTTFQTAVSEYRKLGSAPSILFSMLWHRLILDEAHYIRDRSSISAKAISSLDSRSRWAVTGTPIQNRLADLTAILSFLRVSPYNDKSVFDADITQLWKTGAETEAIERLKHLIGCIALRRSNSTIDLPNRTDIIRYLPFSDAERMRYSIEEENTFNCLQASLSGKQGLTKNYGNVLRGITSLRLICNLGVLAPSLPTPSAEVHGVGHTPLWNSTKARETYDTLVAIGPVQCAKCKKDVSVIECNDSSMRGFDDVHVCECVLVFCGTCVQHLMTARGESTWCGHTPRCALASVSGSQDMMGRASETPGHGQGNRMVPTKIAALVEDLRREADSKSIVFSSWTSTLDHIEKFLQDVSIPCLRFDGSISAKNRAAALHTFQTDPSMKVLLLTISCGAVGLDLTAGNRAYLMEPHWNPTIEEQALARIHRLGQTREITTTRFVMKGTYEERVMELQEKKKGLVDLLLSQKKSAGADGTRTRLMSLCSLL